MVRASFRATPRSCERLESGVAENPFLHRFTLEVLGNRKPELHAAFIAFRPLRMEGVSNPEIKKEKLT